MSQLHSGSATLPKGFRYYDELPGPKTPEPDAPGEEARLPSPPRARFRLKRRHVSQLTAPTQQFLASVAAADVPIPSVEDRDIATVDYEMADSLPEVQVQDFDGMDIYQHIQARKFSPPKTPALEVAPVLSATKYPDWSIDSAWSSSDLESSPDYESSRPSTAFSTQTSASLFSHYSYASDDGGCISPEAEAGDFLKPEQAIEAAILPKEKPRKAPWTQAMSTHLWSTYLLYLQDPRVTPMRLGKSCIPPHGVCLRVARQAKRSWKGSNPKTGHYQPARSRSSTPTAESSTKPFIQWPHTCAATRAHLRELCKLKAAAKPGRPPFMSRSPTPFNKAAHRRWNRRSTPARSPSVFSGNEMAKSLTLSTSDVMQPQGPLAQLTSSGTEPFPDAPMPAEHGLFAAVLDEVVAGNRARLGSPFAAKSYGPSSSSSLAAGISLPRQSNTLGPRKLLKSPVRLTRSRSGTQKRKPSKAFEDMSRKRPSLVATFGKDLSFLGGDEQLQNAQPQPQGASFGGNEMADQFSPKTPLNGPLGLFPGLGMQEEAKPFVVSATTSPTAPASPPARLGSPFSAQNSSHSFPNRLSGPVNFNLTALRRPFATVQQPGHINAETQPGKSSLASRLAYLDQRLKDFRNRAVDRQRSQSPM